MAAFITDTIACDTTLLNDFVTNDKYNYNSELQGENQSLLERAMNSISEWFRDLFSTAQNVEDGITHNISSTLIFILIAVLVIVLLVVLYLMYKRKMFFFKSNKKGKEDYEVEEDSIYGVNFEIDINNALKNGNYKEAVRLTYLQCLRLLSDKELIDWRIYKTPKQYTKEYQDEVFEQFTRRYVFLRYSGCDVTESDYKKISEQKHEIESLVAETTTPSNLQEEGGEDED